MIIGLFLRNFKTYNSTKFIPLSEGDNFCGLIGSNGIGKSSVLEALDSLFNGYDWNYHINHKKQGLDTTKPHIVPIFAIKKGLVSKDVETIEILSNTFWSIEEKAIHAEYKKTFDSFSKFRERIEITFSKDDYYIIPIGLDWNKTVVTSIIRTENIEQISQSLLNSIFTSIKGLFDYVYIPKDIEATRMAQLETRELQAVLGESLHEIIKGIFTPTQVASLNRELLKFINGLSSNLGNYDFRTSQDRQRAVSKQNIYNLIIEDFFRKRVLHKILEEKYIDIAALSSGEKQQAILELYFYLVTQYRNSKKMLIFAIDEPEASMHISACFEQFEKLFDISKKAHQVLFTSHWYGFIPTMESGFIINISKQKDEHKFDIFNIHKYREEVNSAIKDHKGYLPLEIALKGRNDFVQSILSSIIKENPYKWLICEGSSDKIYLQEYLKDLVYKDKLRIIPVGGIPEIHRLYNQLSVYFDDNVIKKEVKGKVLLLSDTDSSLARVDVKDYDRLKNWRLLRNNEVVNLVKLDAGNVSPSTDIEDALNGKAFHRTLCLFTSDHPELLDFIKPEEEKTETPSSHSLNLRENEITVLKSVFNKPGFKCEFSRKYIEIIKSEEFSIPNWIDVIRNFYKD